MSTGVTLKPYSPGQVQVSWGGVALKGFATGTFITAERSVANTTNAVGAQGDVGITLMANKTGVTLTLMQTAESNRMLSAAQLSQDNLDKLFRADLVITDPSGSFLMRAELAILWNQQ